MPVLSRKCPKTSFFPKKCADLECFFLVLQGRAFRPVGAGVPPTPPAAAHSVQPFQRVGTNGRRPKGKANFSSLIYPFFQKKQRFVWRIANKSLTLPRQNHTGELRRKDDWRLVAWSFIQTITQPYGKKGVYDALVLTD